MLAATIADDCHLIRAEPSQVELNPRVLTILSFVIEKMVARNDQLVMTSSDSAWLGKSLKGFHGIRVPSISIGKYLERIYKYTNCSPSCFVVAYVYIDRLVHAHPNSLVVSLNIHRLLVTSLMVAAKMLDDMHHNNAFYARVGGVSNSELNKLELELLFLLDFGLLVSSRVFESYCLHLEKEMMLDSAFHKIDRPLMNSLGDSTEITLLSEDAQSSSSISNG